MPHSRLSLTLPPVRLLSVAVLVLFAAMQLLALFLPLYVDDIRYPLSGARGGYDAWHTISPTAQCGASFATSIPFSLLPGRFLSWSIHHASGNFLWQHGFALLISLSWMCLVAWLARRLLSYAWLPSFGLAAAMAGMGILPFVMIQGRPETGILLCLTFFIALPFMPLTARPLRQYGAVLLVLLTASWFFSAHPKTFLYAPVPLLALWLMPLPKWLRLSTIALFLFIVAQAWLYWQAKLPCPGDPKEDNLRAMQALSPEQLFSISNRLIDGLTERFPHILQVLSDASARLSQGSVIESAEGAAIILGAMLLFAVPMAISVGIIAIYNLGTFYNYIVHMLPGEPKWLPAVTPSWPLQAISIAIGIIAALMLFAILRALIRAVRLHRRDTALYLAVALLVCMGLQSVMQITKVFYESALMWPFLCVMLLLVAHVHGEYRKWLIAIPAVAFVSLLSVLPPYATAITREIEEANANGVLRNTLLLSPFGSGEVAQRTRALAGRCDLNPDASEHVIVDTVTYPGMKAGFRPYLLPVQRAYDNDEVEKRITLLLQMRDASGIVALCSHIPSALRAHALQEQGLCCVKKESLP